MKFKTSYSEGSVCSVAKKKIKNKANFKMGKIDVSSFIKSEYERFYGVEDGVSSKNKANLVRHKMSDYRSKAERSKTSRFASLLLRSSFGYEGWKAMQDMKPILFGPQTQDYRNKAQDYCYLNIRGAKSCSAFLQTCHS
jgi:hypothetical protein